MPAKTYTEFFIGTEKMNHPKSKMEAQKTLYCQSNPQQNEQCCSDLPATLQSYSNKISVVLKQNRHGRLWSKIEDLNMSAHNYRHLIVFDNVAQNTHWIKDRILD